VKAALRYEVRDGQADGHATVTLSSLAADLQATFAPEVGMLGCSLVHCGEELLDMRGGLDEYARTGSAAGIPFLYPWANRLWAPGYSVEGRELALDLDSPLIHLDPNGLPIHGLLAASPHWQVLATGADDTAATLTAELDFGAHEDLLAAFPFPHRVRLDVRLSGSALAIATTVTPTADVSVPISFGFHPYLRLPGVPREQWQIEIPVREHLLLDDRMIPNGQSEPIEIARAPLADRTFDDGYAKLVPQRPFVAAAGGRELQVSLVENFPFAQVYSPPGAEFICFEPMTAPTNALVSGVSLRIVAPGERFTATFAISVLAR
jgi:galactose mutarotase-like enzyme